MKYWAAGETVVVRYIARSDGSVAMAMPTIAIRDDGDVLALFVPQGTVFMDNWVVPPGKRVTAVDNIQPSQQRQHQERVWRNDTIRLYLPGQAFSVWLFFDEDGAFSDWYGNLEAPFVRTEMGIDTRDYGLDITADGNGRWQWKDEDEFARRLERDIDSMVHQTAVRAAGQTFIKRLQNNEFPFSYGWQHWRAPSTWQPRQLPPNWQSEPSIIPEEMCHE